MHNKSYCYELATLHTSIFGDVFIVFISADIRARRSLDIGDRIVNWDLAPYDAVSRFRLSLACTEKVEIGKIYADLEPFEYDWRDQPVAIVFVKSGGSSA